MRKRYGFKGRMAGILAICLLTAVTGCGQSGQDTTGEKKELFTPEGAMVDTDTAAYRDVLVMETAQGSVVADTVELQYEVSGNFKDCYVENGDYVKAGDLLAEIEQTDVNEEIESLEESMAEAEENNAYNNQLTEINLAVQALQYQKAIDNGEDANSLQMKSLELQKAQVKYRQTQESQQADLAYQQSRLDELKAELGETKLVAPCDGIISGIRFADYGDYISEDTIVMTISKVKEDGSASEGSLKLSSAYVNQKYINSCADYYALIDGKRYEIAYQAYTAIELEQLDYYGTAFPAYFTLEDDVEGLTFGSYAQICYVTKESLHTIAVLSNAVNKDAKGYYVFLVDEDGNRTRADVEIGLKNQVYTEITDGVSEGDVVYVQN